MEIDRYVMKGIDMAWQAYFIMAEGESIELPSGTIECPTYAGVPEGCMVAGLFTPIRIERTWGSSSHRNYMELISIKKIKGEEPDKEIIRVLRENEPAYVWFAENGAEVLTRLAKRRNDAVVCVRVPESIKENLDKLAEDKGLKISDMLRPKIEELLLAGK